MLPISRLLERLGVKPKKHDLYELAITHPSYHADTKERGGDYERLEFMGDAIISLIVAETIYKTHPEFDQGTMSKTRAKLVQTESLFRIARDLDLAEYVRIGHSISKEIVATSKKILEDVFEALLGAIFIDQGYLVAKRVIVSLFQQAVIDIDVGLLTDYKTQLQEAIQAEHRESVVYTVEEESGPSHDRHFSVVVSFGGMVLGRGSGSTKKMAEQQAAYDALKKKAI